ncbi:type II secretion system protein GspL [Azonexus sp.]|uniref:type II secretion system protein GspL n=1 Tax=Azonexus sp. TaxID=1872668 RepID=UPI0035B292B0
MNQILTLIIPSGWPQESRACPWQLHAADGRLLAQGCAEPGQWPAADDGDRCRLLLAGRQVAAQPARLPPPPQGERQAVIAAALEDSLLEPAEHLLFVLDPTPLADGRRCVASVGRARLAALCQRLRELGWPPAAAWPLALALPSGQALALGGELSLRQDEGFVALPLDATLADWLDLLAPATPLRASALDADAAHTLAAAGKRLQAEELPPLRIPDGPGFLVGELAPPRPHVDWARRLRPALRLAAGLGALLVLTAAGQWGWHAWQARQLRSEIARQFGAILPQTPMVDPILQARRQLASRLQSSGALAADDFLVLADTLADLPPEQLPLQALAYADGRLHVSVARLDAGATERLAAAARQRGLTLSPPAGTPPEFTLSAGERR